MLVECWLTGWVKEDNAGSVRRYIGKSTAIEMKASLEPANARKERKRRDTPSSSQPSSRSEGKASSTGAA